MKQSIILRNIVATVLVASLLFFTSCVKDRNAGAPDFTKLTPIMQIVEGGLTAKGFGNAALLFPGGDLSDTAYFRVNYAATTVAPNDISVTLAIDDAARLKYNTDNPSSQYEKMPDSLFKFTQTQVTIKAGQSYSDLVKLTVYPSKINVSKSYMIPITITAASGVNISGNFGTIYYHVIGNPLAGTYVVTGIRYNYNGGPSGSSGVFNGNPANIPPGYTGTTAIPTPKVAAPVDGNTVAIDFANLGGNGYQYLLTQKNNFASLSIDFNATMLGGDSNINTWLFSYTAPTPTTKAKFRILTQYVNNANPAAGNDRILDESFVQQ
jgi:hypothetical protein